MSVVCVGISHHTAPVALRERLALTPVELERLYARAGSVAELTGGAEELVVLSTCNRTEIYAASADGEGLTPEAGAALLHRLLRERTTVPAAALYHRAQREAVRHLCRVAAGLDSMVIGEAEILGQVARAAELAEAAGVAGPILRAAFTAAVRAGRRARTETGIGRNASSVSGEAVRLLRELRLDLAAQRVLVVGTGKMGRLAGTALRAAGVRELAVISRTTAHAEALAGSWGARARAWHELVEAVTEADVILTSTGAPHAVVTAELVRLAVAAAPIPRVFVDIAVPRDVEPEVAALPGTRVFDMDALQQRVGANLVARTGEVPAVERVVEDEVAWFEAWRRNAALRPTLAAIHARGETLRRRELERLARRLGTLAPDVRAELERFSSALIGGLLYEPSRRLREETDPERRAALAEAMRTLFGLDAAAGGDAEDAA
jgi:glutamyl-tRNA reductase